MIVLLFHFDYDKNFPVMPVQLRGLSTKLEVWHTIEMFYT